jgi:competence protein ComEA
MIRNLFAAIAVLVSAFALNAHAAVDANQASRADLETVKGIGPGLSGKIVEARKAGDFKSWNDLVERIGGVGPANAARLSQAGLTVAGTAYDPGTMPAKAPKTQAPETAARTAKAPKAGQ